MISEKIFENRMNHVALLNQMGASIVVKNNIAHIKGVKKLKGTDLIGTDLRSSAALVIAALVSENISKIYGLEHLDRGYEEFEYKLSKLGVNIKREIKYGPKHNKKNDLLDKDLEINIKAA